MGVRFCGFFGASRPWAGRHQRKRSRNQQNRNDPRNPQFHDDLPRFKKSWLWPMSVLQQLAKLHAGWPHFTRINHVGLRFDTFAADISIFWRRCATLSFIVASTLESVAQTSPQIPARGELAAVPWYVWSLFAAVVSVVIGGYWDISWHMSIGRDTFWTPAHMLIQFCGILA